MAVCEGAVVHACIATAKTDPAPVPEPDPLEMGCPRTGNLGSLTASQDPAGAPVATSEAETPPHLTGWMFRLPATVRPARATIAAHQ